jgi:hypothetical protein
MNRPAAAGLALCLTLHEFLGRCPRLFSDAAPLALNGYSVLTLGLNQKEMKSCQGRQKPVPLAEANRLLLSSLRDSDLV